MVEVVADTAVSKDGGSSFVGGSVGSSSSSMARRRGYVADAMGVDWVVGGSSCGSEIELVVGRIITRLTSNRAMKERLWYMSSTLSLRLWMWTMLNVAKEGVSESGTMRSGSRERMSRIPPFCMATE